MGMSSWWETGDRKALGVTLAVCLAFAFLASAQGASAAKGVYDTFGSIGTKGGEFGANGSSGISGVAVNSAGAGAADPGDVYVLDRGQNRVQRFDADGKFVSAFGQDVVESGPGNNGTGYEICKAASGDVCKAGISGSTGGALNIASSLALSGIAVDQTSGSIYVSDRANRRIQRFDAEGNFIRAFGKDVVSSGAEQADEQQRLTVDASAGQYKLSFGAGGPGVSETADIAWNATPAVVQAALEGISNIGPGNVTVTGGVGGTGGATPYLIAFGGSLANVDLATIAVSVGTTPLSGGAATATITTFNEGAVGFEICETAANCKASPSNATTGGGFNTTNLGSLAVAPAGAPNAGNVLVADGGGGAATASRVQEFTSTGAFVRTFGWDVVDSGPSQSGTAFEVCSAAALDLCKGGTTGSGSGQFNQGPSQIAEDSSGNIYTVESFAGFRVQRFTLPGNVVTPQGEFDPAELKGSIGGGGDPSNQDNPIAVAVDTSTAPGTPGTVYVLKYVPKGSGTPPLEEKEARILAVDPSADGGNGTVVDEFMVRGEAGSSGASVTALALNTASDRLYVTEPPAPVYIVDEVPPVSVSLEPTEAGATTATLHATITPAALPKLTTFYRFEYTREGSEEWKRVPLENDVDLGKDPVPVAVSQKAEGLEINTCYDLRAIAYSRFHGAEGLAEGTFCTQAVKPQVSTGPARWSSPPATNPSLTLYGKINPGKDQTTYVFEYVSEAQFDASGFSGAERVPLLPAPAGHGLFNVLVLQSIPGLDPTKPYVYRLVATNSVGTEAGTERTVAPPQPGSRFFELVSDSDSKGLGVRSLMAVSDDGERAALQAQSLADPQSLPSQTSPFIAQRGAGGWEVHPVVPGPAQGEAGSELDFRAWLPADLSRALWAHYSASGQIRGEYDWTFTGPDGSTQQVLPTLVPVTGSGTKRTTLQLMGAATDLSSFVFQREEATSSDPAVRTMATYLPGQPPTTGGDGDIYRVTGAGGPTPTMTLVNRDAAGSLISNSCGVWLGARKFNFAPNPAAANRGMNLRPVSADGSVSYFSARPSGSTACNEAVDRIRIFKRIGDTATVEVSKAQCSPGGCKTEAELNGDDFFQAASANGNRVFFTTTRQLTDSDEDTSLDLYLYDSDPPAGQPNLVQASSKTGVAAVVQESVVDVSVDGSRAYFVAKGALATGAVAGNDNLYVYQRDNANPSGRIAFVAKLDAGDGGLWVPGGKAAFALPTAGPGGIGAGDGRFLLFGTRAKLLGADTDSVTDLYRYEDTSGQTICLTCAGSGAFGVSVTPHRASRDPAGPQRDRIASEDLSTVAFSTVEALAPNDENAVSDAYVWKEGALELISTGDEDSAGVTPLQGDAPSLSADGSAAFFVTADRILPADTNSAVDAYSARIGGGFPEAGEAARCESAWECRTEPEPEPPLPVVGTTVPRAGNPIAAQPPKKPKCPKGKVRKKGRCVKKPKKAKGKQKAAKQRAGSERGVRR